MKKKNGEAGKTDSVKSPSGMNRSREVYFGMAALALMLVCVCAVYTTLPVLTGKEFLLGSDYVQLHMHRIEYLKESLSEGRGVPGWYSREFLGTPFWSNIQNFPLIPTRLVFFLFDSVRAYYFAVILAAALSALFTFLFCRRAGLSPASSAVAGWTFACAGFFAARVTVGHLTLLEGYLSLPLLLWLAQRWLRDESGKRNSAANLVPLALACAAVCLSGHPQLPFYAVVAVSLYILWTERSREAFYAIGSMAAGALSTLFVWFPFLLLLRRSSRALALEPPANDIPFPYGRLKAFVAPWADGWIGSLIEPEKAFTGYPTLNYFWDTVCYVGIVPLLAVVFLAAFCFIRGRNPGKNASFFILAGTLSLVAALPFINGFNSLVPVTLLRSPARQVYVTIFCLCLGLGAAVHVLEKLARERRSAALAFLLAVIAFIHVTDLGRHDRHFVKGYPFVGCGIELPDLDTRLKGSLGDARVAVDYDAFIRSNRRFDDAGFFDAVALADTYSSVLRMGGLGEKLNTELIEGTTLPAGALQKLGVKYVITARARRDLKPISSPGGIVNLYMISSPEPRASFVPSRGNVTGEEWPVEYERASSDRMELKCGAGTDGMIKVIESWDPGWSATLDGKKAPVEKIEGFMMGVKVPSGEHAVVLRYRTPGAKAGALLSLSGPALLLVILLAGKRKRERVPEQSA